jgi:hypothetical protein
MIGGPFDEVTVTTTTVVELIASSGRGLTGAMVDMSVTGKPSEGVSVTKTMEFTKPGLLLVGIATLSGVWTDFNAIFEGV